MVGAVAVLVKTTDLSLVVNAKGVGAGGPGNVENGVGAAAVKEAMFGALLLSR